MEAATLEVFNQCKAAGVSLHSDDGKTLIATPAASLTPELREVIAAHKAALLQRICPCLDVSSVILIGAECNGLNAYTTYAAWRVKKAFELVERTCEWLTVNNLDFRQIKLRTIREAEVILMDAARSFHPDTFDLADAHFNRVREYCVKLVKRNEVNQ